MSSSNAKSQKSRRDAAVQGTNDSSIVSKCSMARHGYFCDEYLHRFVTKESRRAPLIHRGYFIRARAMDYILREFLKQSTQQEKQVISLGAGFDSSFFRLASESLLDDTVYVELDFPEVVRRKGEIILQSEALKTLVKVDSHSPIHTGVVLNTNCYKLIGVDLNHLPKLEELLRVCLIKGDNPTLFLSECVMTYMTPSSSTTIIQWANQKFDFATFVLYEQINPGDAFGQVMLNHFAKIGSPLQCIQTYPTRMSQLQRFKLAGWETVETLDMNQFYQRLVTGEERQRICCLEPFDEYEEWHLKCAHYMILCAYNSDDCPRLLRVLHTNPEASGEDIAGELCEPRSCSMKSLNISQVSQRQDSCMMKLRHLHCQHSAECDMGETDICQARGESSRVAAGSERCLLPPSEKKDSDYLEEETELEKVGRDCSEAIHCVTAVCEANFCETSMGKTNAGVMFSCETNPIKADIRETIPGQTLHKPQPKLVSFPDDQRQNSDPNSSLLQRFGHSSVLLGRHIVTVGGFGNCGSKHCRLQNGVLTDVWTWKNLEMSIPADFALDVLHHTLVTLETEGSSLLLGGRHSPVKCNKQMIKFELTFPHSHQCAASGPLRLCETKVDLKESSQNVNQKETPGWLEGKDDSNQSLKQWLVCSHHGDMENGRWRHTAVRHGSEVYVYGGRNEKWPALGDCLMYDVLSQTWTKLPAIGQSPRSRHSHTAAIWKEQMVIVGGVDQELFPLNSIHLLDLETKHWVQLKLMGHLKPRYSHTSHVVEDLLILVGGVNLDHAPPGLAVVNLRTGLCEEFDLPQENGHDVVMYHKHSSVLLDSSQLMVIGGGGNCFSFGTHINRRPVILDIGACLQYCQARA